MKIKANLSFEFIHLAPALALSLCVSAMICIGLTVWLIRDAVVLKDAKPLVTERLADMARKHADIKATELPSRAELTTLRDRVAIVKTLYGQPQAPLSAFLGRLEKLLPDAVYLTNLNYKNNGEVGVTAESQSVESLTAFLVKLQKQEGFSQVLLTKQSQRVERGLKLIQFELRIKAAV